MLVTIGIHGYSHTMPPALRQVEELRKKIDTALEGASYRDKVVVEHAGGPAEDLNGNHVPFLRVYLEQTTAEGSADANDLLERLQALKMRIEVPMPGMIIDAEKEEPQPKAYVDNESMQR
ncbi:MAG: hypothetical protein V4474_03210 [Patescibacteria group bacterium]